MKTLPIALTIAGSDSGGGAGIQADLKTFAALGTHGTSALTCLTAQSPAGFASVHPCPAAFVRSQLDVLSRDLPATAAKTGMLFSAGIIRSVADWIESNPGIPVVVDPVMIATSGARLLRPDARRALLDRLVPSAAIVTPNLDEAVEMLGRPLSSVEDLRHAARAIHGRWGVPALVKGGHLRDTRLATDVLWDGSAEEILTATFVRGVATHGTGCTYSAAITAFLARGMGLPAAVKSAKKFITDSIRDSVRIAGHTALDPLHRHRSRL
jgi:hydroxymethylpyrimidine/phosphomethylpyrimidine kinase